MIHGETQIGASVCLSVCLSICLSVCGPPPAAASRQPSNSSAAINHCQPSGRRAATRPPRPRCHQAAALEVSCTCWPCKLLCSCMSIRASSQGIRSYEAAIGWSWCLTPVAAVTDHSQDYTRQNEAYSSTGASSWQRSSTRCRRGPCDRPAYRRRTGDRPPQRAALVPQAGECPHPNGLRVLRDGSGTFQIGRLCPLNAHMDTRGTAAAASGCCSLATGTLAHPAGPLRPAGSCGGKASVSGNMPDSLCPMLIAARLGGILHHTASGGCEARHSGQDFLVAHLGEWSAASEDAAALLRRTRTGVTSNAGVASWPSTAYLLEAEPISTTPSSWLGPQPMLASGHPWLSCSQLLCSLRY